MTGMCANDGNAGRAMILVRLVGGLGNQLFQYACARAVALRNRTELAFDLRELSRGAPHAVYGLDRFDIAGRVAEAAELPPPRSRVIPYAFWRAGLMRPRFLRERGLGLNRAVIDAPDGTYLHGYFQSESYFRDQADRIREDLRIVSPPDPINAEWEGRIAADPAAASLHVRRGDYLATADGQSVHGVCEAAYYSRALSALRDRIGKTPTLYVFSDDPVWARSNLRLDAPMVVLDHNGPAAAVEDLRLMSACRHHIVANSSFSWWGAWRNPRPDKVVIAPATWFADPSLHNPDICPPDWVRV